MEPTKPIYESETKYVTLVLKKDDGKKETRYRIEKDELLQKVTSFHSLVKDGLANPTENSEIELPIILCSRITKEDYEDAEFVAKYLRKAKEKYDFDPERLLNIGSTYHIPGIIALAHQKIHGEILTSVIPDPHKKVLEYLELLFTKETDPKVDASFLITHLALILRDHCDPDILAEKLCTLNSSTEVDKLVDLIIRLKRLDTLDLDFVRQEGSYHLVVRNLKFENHEEYNVLIDAVNILRVPSLELKFLESGLESIDDYITAFQQLCNRFNHNHVVEHLKLTLSGYCQSEAVTHLTQFLDCFTNLKSLTLGDTRRSPETLSCWNGLETLTDCISKMEGLRELVLVDVYGGSLLTKVVNTKGLESITFQNVGFGEEGMKALCNDVSYSKISKIYFSHIPNLEDDGLERLGSLLRGHAVIGHFGLAYQEVSRWSLHQVIPTEDAISDLESLILDGNPIRNEGVEHLMTLLNSKRIKASPTLTTLSLKSCEIGDLGIKHILAYLEENPETSLRTIFLDGNHVSPMMDENITKLKEEGKIPPDLIKIKKPLERII